MAADAISRALAGERIPVDGLPARRVTVISGLFKGAGDLDPRSPDDVLRAH